MRDALRDGRMRCAMVGCEARGNFHRASHPTIVLRIEEKTSRLVSRDAGREGKTSRLASRDAENMKGWCKDVMMSS